MNNNTTKPVRVFLANQPRMVRQMLRRAIQKSPHLRVVGEAQKVASIVSAPALMSIDWLVVSLTEGGQIPEHCRNLTERYPSLWVLGLSEDGREMALQSSRDKGKHWNDVSLQTLLAVLQNPGRTTQTI